MFFEKDILSFHILDVLKINQENIHRQNSWRNFNAISFRLKADSQLQTHSHTYHLTDNYITYVPARIRYTHKARKDELIAVHFDTTDYHTDTIECFQVENADALSALFEEILACWNEKKIGYKYRCSAILYEIFKECHVQNFKTINGNSKIQRSVDFLLKNYKNPNITIDEIAKKSFISAVYFRKLFKADFDTSPQKYIIRLRIQCAKGLIATGYYSLKEVARLSGYTDYKYFSFDFKRAVGISPSDYVYNFKNE